MKNPKQIPADQINEAVAKAKVDNNEADDYDIINGHGVRLFLFFASWDNFTAIHFNPLNNREQLWDIWTSHWDEINSILDDWFTPHVYCQECGFVYNFFEDKEFNQARKLWVLRAFVAVMQDKENTQ